MLRGALSGGGRGAADHTLVTTTTPRAKMDEFEPLYPEADRDIAVAGYESLPTWLERALEPTT